MRERVCTDKKENEIFLSYIRKFRWDRSQSHICMRKGFLIYEEMRKYLAIYEVMRRLIVIYDFATSPF